jgi:hypothetical protein
MMKFQINEKTIFIVGFDGDYQYDPYEADETPISADESEFLETMHLDGYGDHLSKYIVELTSYPWVDRSNIDQIIDFMRLTYPDNKINWKETLNYLEGYK